MNMKKMKRMPEVDVTKLETLLTAAKEYHEVKENIDTKIASALKTKDMYEKDLLLREIRMML